jgi:biotin carboxyl carrier protein
MTVRELHWKVAGQDLDVRIEDGQDHGTIQVGGRSLPFRIVERHSHGGTIEIDGRNSAYFVHHERNECTVWLRGHTYHLARVPKGTLLQPVADGSEREITALMPGTILRIEVALGDVVVAKQTLIVMESMKMENAIAAPKAGRVVQIHCEVSSVVDAGQVLLTLD